MGAALEVEVLKLRRATAPRVAALAVAVGVPALGAAFMAVARADGESQMAAKVRPMLVGTGWEAYLTMIGQVLSVGVLLAVGVVVCWSFGREFTDGTFGSLFAIPTARRDIALAKATVLLGWGLGLCVATVVIAVPLGVLTGVGAPGEGMVAGVVRTLVVGGLMVVLSLPLALVASMHRGYLPGIAGLLGIVVVTQIVTVAGAGTWFPYAAPGLWAGMGGPEAAAAVGVPHLLLALPVGLGGAVATAWWWGRAEAI
ncbi:ABC transporter permease [Actinotalea sp. K2]|uniref:ABC transporter permease n=1 Tax=Actinotalea sp. K2 TaxID=2939438 RepID=UPI002016C1F2|nr:ABC transporter permease [Actinotalea sp. K2]MCL3861754.1 ABC transporter permease [Actinotalea sp. K2]